MSGRAASSARAMSSHRSTLMTVYPCSRSSQERALRMAGFSSAMRTRGSAATEELTQSVPLDVAATEHRHRLAVRAHEPFEQRGDGDRAARLGHELHPVEEEAH